MTARNWISTVSCEHILIGVSGGFAKMNHGKLAPLKRLSPGDNLIYYAPKTAYPDGAPLKAFTAVGTVRQTPPYQDEMRFGGQGYRLDIDWMPARETPIVSLTDRPEFTRGNRGMLAGCGSFDISDAEFQTTRATLTGD